MENKAPLLPFRQSNGRNFPNSFRKLPEHSPLNPINSDPLSGFLPWQPAAWLHVTGEDAFTFLQGQFTNDLKRAADGGVYGLWLSLKGKVLGDSFIVAGAAQNEFWIGSYHTPASTLRERLESFVIADDVIIENQTADWQAVSVFGSDAAATVERGRAAGGPGAGFSFSGRRSRSPNAEWVFRREAEPAVRASLSSLRESDTNEMEAVRISAGIPSVPADIGPNDLPNEGGLELEAISYTKGCYLGQEVMARLKSMGQVRRRLLRVRGRTAEVPVRGTALFAGGRQVGELRSVVKDGDDFIGLAMISMINLAGNAAVSVGLEAVPEIQILDVP